MGEDRGKDSKVVMGSDDSDREETGEKVSKS